ncbi:MAG: putative quinol monooxygenase [Acidobacteriota bacterium]
MKTEQETITFTARLTIKKGKEKEFETIMKEVVPKVRAEEGNLAYTMCRSKDNPRLFLFFEEYTEQSAVEAHSRHLGEMEIDFAAYLEGPPVAEYFVKIAD